MSDQDIFENKETEEQITQEPPVTQEPPSDPFVDKLSAIKNENGEPKYKDVSTALDALSASQQFIEQLKREKREVEEKLLEREEKLQKMGNIDDFVNRITNTAKPQEPAKTTEDSKGISEDMVRQLLEQQLSQREGAAKKQANLDQVVHELNQRYGDQAAARIKDKAKELGTTPEELKELSRNNPKMVLSLFVDSKVSSAPSQSSTFSPRGSDKIEPPKIENGRGIARGGYTSKEMAELFRKSKEYTNKRLGIE